MAATLFLGSGWLSLGLWLQASDHDFRTDPVPAVAADLDQYIPPALARAGVPGLSLALIRDGAVVWERGYGVANGLTRAPVTPETAFPVASMGKAAATYAALRLVERGALALDSSLNLRLASAWLPDSADRERITLRHVLAHTSGLSNFLGDRVRRTRFQPGDRFAYSGVGFMYLQRVLETFDPGGLDGVCRREVFEPLAMTGSWFADRPPGARSVAAGHLGFGQAVAPVTIVFLPLAAAALAVASLLARVGHGTWSVGRYSRLLALAGAAAVCLGFLLHKAANPRLIPFFVLCFAALALAAVSGGHLLARGLGRKGWRWPASLAMAAAILFGLARLPVPVPAATPPGGNAASSLRATAPDLARLFIELARSRHLRDDLARELRQPQVRASEHLAWGLGVGLQPEPSGVLLFNWGTKSGDSRSRGHRPGRTGRSSGPGQPGRVRGAGRRYRLPRGRGGPVLG